MKKTNFLKFALTLVMAFVMTSAWAQIPADFSLYDANKTVPTAIDSVTTLTTTRYFVVPDPYFHPLYAGAGTLTAGFTWTWTIPTNPGGATFAATNNSVDITWGTVGSYVVNVIENGPTCSSAITTIMNTNVIAAPTVAFTADNDGGGILGIDIDVCAGGLRTEDDVQATFTGDKPNYMLDWDLKIYTLTSGGAPDTYYAFDKTTPVAAGVPARDYDRTAGTQVTGITTYTHTLDKPAGGWTVIGTQSTVYLYTISAVNGRISRKGDYIANPTKAAAAWTWDDIADHVITIKINPAPITGPIYHISNTWAN